MQITTSRLVRLSAIVILLFAAGHMLGAANSWSPAGETATLQAMKESAFDVMGTQRTYWHFYYGFGLYIGLLLTAQGIALWQVAALPIRLIRPVLMTTAAAWIGGTVILWRYIFIVPAVFSLVCSACVIAALISSTRNEGERN
jgi:hypothetical protein